MSFSWLPSSLGSRGARSSRRKGASNDRRRAQDRRRRMTLESLEDRTVLSTFTWTGASGVDLNWSTAANWSPAKLPGPKDDVVFATNPANSVVDVDFSDLVRQAQGRNVLIELTQPVGAFLQEREAVAVIRDPGGDPISEVPEDLTTSVLAAFVVSHERTVDADPAYAVRLLVDIALRALSPGVNDPTTAAQAMDHLSQLVVALAGRRLGPRELRDDDGVVRVRVPAPGWEPLVGLAFDELVEAADADRVRRHLLGVIEQAAARVATDRRPPLEARASRLGGPTSPSAAH